MGAKRRKGSKTNTMVDTPCHLLALHVMPTDEQDRAQVRELARQVRKTSGEQIELASVDKGCMGGNAVIAAQLHDM